jgi:hypothetical protein
MGERRNTYEVFVGNLFEGGHIEGDEKTILR